MKTIRINGSFMAEVNINHFNLLNEGLFDKSGFIGKLLSFVPGFSAQQEGDKLSEYEKVQNDWVNKWKSAREEELKKNSEHIMKMKATNYSILQQQKYNKYKAEQKIKEFKRKQELDARKAILAKLKAEENKIKSWNASNISTPQFMNSIILKTEKIYKDSTPAEQQLKDNVLGVISSVYYDDKGNFISDPDKQKQRLDDLYGDGTPGSGLKNELFNDPAIKKAYEKYQKSRPESESDFNKMATGLIHDKDLRNEEDIKKDSDLVNGYMNIIDEKNKTINEQKQIKSDLEKTQKTLQANIEKTQKSLDEQNDAMKGFPEDKETLKPEDMKKHIRKQIKKSVDVAEIDGEALFHKVKKNDENGKNIESTEINTKSEQYKQLKQLGLSDDDINSIYTGGKIQNTQLNKLIDKIDNDKLNNYRDGIYNRRQTLQDDLKRMKEDESMNIQEMDKCDDKINEAEELAKTQMIELIPNDTDNYQDNPQSYLDNEIKRITNKPNDGTPVTMDDVSKADAILKQEQSDLNETSKIVKSSRDAALDSLNTKKSEDGYKKAYDKLSTEDKKKIDNIQPTTPDIIKTDDDGQYIEIEVKNDKGEKETKKLYKPKEDDPAYQEKLEKWDTTVAAKYATMKVGDKPIVVNPNNPTIEELEAYKQWEVNKQAKEAAVQKFIESNKQFKTADDALEYLEDQEWENDKENKDKTDYENDEENMNKDDNKDFTEDDEEKENVNPARIWKRKKNQNTGKSTKRYYYQGKNAGRKENNESISAKEYKEKLENYKKKKTTNNTTKDPDPKEPTKEPTKEPIKKSTKKPIKDSLTWKTTPISKIVNS